MIPVELTDRLGVLASERGATLFHVFLAAFKVLLHRLSGSEDIAVGSPISGRTRAEIEPLIGTFINTVVLRTDLSGNPTFATALDRVRETSVEALAHQSLPFEALVRELHPARDPSRNPLVQINFTHQRDFVRSGTMGPLRLIALPSWSPGDPAYLLYTRGSTGEPKGVLVPNRAVVRLVRGQDYASFGPDEVFLLAAAMSFDASTFELWGALLNGATLSLQLPGCFGLAGLARSVRENGVTVLWLAAGLFQVMIEEHSEDLVGLRYLLAGGDVPPRALRC